MIIIMIIIFPNTEKSENNYSAKNKSKTDKQQHKHTQGPSGVLHFTRGERNE